MNKSFKKLLSVSLIFVMALAMFAGCGNNNAANGTTDNNGGTTDEPSGTVRDSTTNRTRNNAGILFFSSFILITSR